MPLHFSVCSGSHLCGFLLLRFLCRFILPYTRPLSHSCPWTVWWSMKDFDGSYLLHVLSFLLGWVLTEWTVMHGILGNAYKSLLSINSTPIVGCCSSYLFRLMMLGTVFQTEPVINEESEGIEENTQIRSQGIIALSYRDWEVRPCRLPSAVLWLLCCKPTAWMFLFLTRRLWRPLRFLNLWSLWVKASSG